MNIQRFMLPASIAAAIHVALLWTVSGEPGPLRIKIMEVPLISDPLPKPDEPVVVAPEGKSDTMEPVKSLGGPTPPEAPEPEVVRKPDDVSIPTPDKPIYPKEDTKIIPRTPGSDGIHPWGRDGGGTIIDFSKLDRMPRAKVQMAPDYPAAMRHDGVSGSVKVEFDVDVTGRVREARVVESSRRDFEEPALRAVRKWQFEPGKRFGKAVPFRMTVPIEFGIKTN